MPLLHRSLTTTLFGLLALTAVSPSRAQLLDATWIGPATGDWSDAANWSTGVVPDLGAYAVRVDANAAQATTVGVDGQFTVFDLSLDEGDRVSLAEGALLELDDISTIAGEVRIAPTASFLARSLLRIEPTGRIRLEPDEEGAGVALLSRGPGGDDRWNHGVIEGAGVVQTTGGFFNLGAIEANVDGRDLTLIRSFGGANLLTNSGVFRATNGGTLNFNGEGTPVRLLNQMGGQSGRIEAAAGSSVLFDTILVEGGVLSGATAVDGPGGTTPGGTLSITDGGVRDVTIEGEIELTSSEIAGVINNTGTMNALGASVRGTTELRGGGSVIVGGPTGFGTISIAESGSDSTRTLINHDNVIRGNGGISFGVNRTGLFINRETIEAGFGPDETPAQNVGFGVLGYGSDTHRVVNSGSIRALTNAELRLSGVAVTNHEGATPGLVEAMSGGVVTLDNVTISGGILRAAPSPAGSGSPATAAGLVVVEAAELADLRLEGTIGDASDFGTIALAGAIDNRGALNAYDLALAEDAELRGGGEVNIGGRLALSDDATRDRRLTLTNHDNRIRLDSVDSSEPIGIANYGTLASVRDEDTSVDVSDLGQADLINGGIVNAETGSRLVVGSITADPAHNDTAVVHAEAGATIRAARIVGGTITTAPAEGDTEAGRVEILRPNGTAPNEVNFGDVRNLGVVEVTGFLGGEIQNENEIIVPVVAVGLDHLVRLSGSGVLRVAEGAHLRAATSDISILFNGPDHTLTGQGTIVHTGGTMINEGTILADDGQLTVSLLVVGRMLHTGVLRSEEGGTLLIDGGGARFTNGGRIEAAGGGIDFVEKTIINSAGSEIAVDGTLTALGIDNRVGGDVRGDGFALLGGGMPEDPPSFVNAGTLTPGAVVNGFNVRGTFAQTETGVLVIEVDGFDAGGFHGGEGEMQHGVLRVEEECCGGVLATTQLAGELRFDFDESLVPQLGDDVRFLRGDVAGVFDTVTGLPSLADGLAWTLLYGPTGASAVVTIAGDFNADGVVDAADYTVWRDGLGVTHTQADYAVWEANFGATGDAFAATAATPEPTTFLLVACAVAARATRHRRC